MQQAYNSYYIDPKDLHPNLYSEIAESQASTAFDDIAVTSGQASFDDGDGEKYTQQRETPSIQGHGADGSDYIGAFDLRLSLCWIQI